MPGGPQYARTPGRILVPLFFSIMRGAFKIFQVSGGCSGEERKLHSAEAPSRFEKGSSRLLPSGVGTTYCWYVLYVNHQPVEERSFEQAKLLSSARTIHPGFFCRLCIRLGISNKTIPTFNRMFFRYFAIFSSETFSQNILFWGDETFIKIFRKSLLYFNPRATVFEEGWYFLLVILETGIVPEGGLLCRCTVVFLSPIPKQKCS